MQPIGIGGGVRQMHLNAFLMTTGHHEASWRMPESNPLASMDVEHYKHMARTAERGKLDSVFLADSPSIWGGVGRRPTGVIDPVTLLTALAGATERVGLIATASTSFNFPYNLARRFASLDHVSGGRAGWNIVTTSSPDAALNFGSSGQEPHAQRYQRAREFMDVVLKLWDSWEDDAILADKAAGLWANEEKVHPAAHRGRFYSVQGALNVPRSPQGYPVLVQAGSSEDGKAFASRFAEAVFTAQQTLAHAQAFYADIKAGASSVGRGPGSVKVLPGLVPVLGGTEAEARRREQQLEDMIVQPAAQRELAKQLNLAPEELPLDKPLPATLPSEAHIQAAKSRYSLIVELGRRENLTVRQLIGRLGGGRGHRTFAGTPDQVAATMEEWFHTGAADGFNVMAPVLPSGLEDFVDHVVPILRSRGLFRDDYTGSTLRDHYGLRRPANQYVVDRAERVALVGSAP
ncbi:MAG TPA: LLM class flavin-dependent oxidoreductase [Acidimicrobiales bacterium]|nr:LLM class flavin-dependent oxidoreductase [Acidimicrobiales bacterium]